LCSFLFSFLSLTSYSLSAVMSDAVTINLDDAPIIVEKCGRSRPSGSKNKVKIHAAASTSRVPVKRRHFCPVGSKNKKSSDVVIDASAAPDVGLAQLILSQRSSSSTFCFFCFCGHPIPRASKPSSEVH
jgi:hypothetical protein